MKINRNFLGRGGGGFKIKNILWGEYGYFVELYNASQTCLSARKVKPTDRYTTRLLAIIYIPAMNNSLG